MLSMDFIRANRDAVRQAIAAKGVDLDLDALLALDAEVRAAKGEIEALRAERNAISAGFQSAAPEERAALGAKAKAAGAKAGELETALADKEAALKAMMLKLPGIPWEGAPVGPERGQQCRHPHRGRGAEIRFRAARPCRADREERLGRS